MKPTTEDYIQSILVSIQDIQRRLEKHPELNNEQVTRDARRIDGEMAELRDWIYLK